MALSKYSATEINGFVQFKFSSGDATVAGKYPRIKPNHFRKDSEIDTKVAITALTRQLLEAGTAAGFASPGLEAAALFAAQLGVYTYPTAPLESKELFFVLRHIFWYSLYSAALSKTWESQPDIAVIRGIHENFAKVIAHQAFDAVELPEFGGLTTFLEGSVQLGVDLAGDEYPEKIQPYLAALQFSFESNEWFTASPLDGKTTLKTYHLWRMGSAGGEGILEVVAFASNLSIPDTTRVTPAFKRMVAIVMSNVAWIQDLFQSVSEGENEVNFRVQGKGESLEEAVSGTCSGLDEELHDLIMIKEALVNVMGVDEPLGKYLDAVDNLVDGQNLARTGADGLILSRDEEGVAGFCVI